MLRVILMRHADAEPPRGRRDHERPLSRAGRREAKAAGEELAAAGLVPEIALVSDSLRTRATLERVCTGFAAEVPSRTLPSLHGASPDAILAALGTLPVEIRTALVIGHNPGIGDLARTLARIGEAADLAALQAHFPTGCRAVLELDGTDWRALAPGRLDQLLGGKAG